MRAPNIFVVFVPKKKFQEFQRSQTSAFFFRLLPMRRSWRFQKKVFACISFVFKANRSIHSRPYTPTLLKKCQHEKRDFIHLIG